MQAIIYNLIADTADDLVRAQKQPFPSDTTPAQAIFIIFGLMILAFGLTAGAIALNARLAKRDKRIIKSWLESQGNTVQKMEWILYPTLKWRWDKQHTYEVRFIDASGRGHHAFLGVGIFENPWIIEDNVTL